MAIKLAYYDNFDLSLLRLEDKETGECVYPVVQKIKKYKWKMIKFLKLPKEIVKYIASYLEQIYITIPLYFATSYLKVYPDTSNIYKQEIKMNPSFQLRDYQKDAYDDIMKSINKYRTALLSFHTGAGKTLTAIYTSAQIGLKTLILYHLKNLEEQWQDELDTLLNMQKYQVLTSKSEIDKTCNYYLCNISTAGKLVKKDPHFFDDIGFLIIDEIHCYYTEKRITTLLHIKPICSLALSATPDEATTFLQPVVNLFFGKKRITKSLHIEGTVYKLPTKLKPTLEYDMRGKLIWSSVLEYQANHPDRNRIILDIINHATTTLETVRNIIVLCKRIDQAKFLYDNCDIELKEILTGKTKKFNKNCRVLFTTYSKSGVGFNLKHLNMLIIASDVGSYISQYFGRITRDASVQPIVIDLVDDQSSLANHWYERRKYYMSVGGHVKDYIKDTSHGPKLLTKYPFLRGVQEVTCKRLKR